MRRQGRLPLPPRLLPRAPRKRSGFDLSGSGTEARPIGAGSIGAQTQAARIGPSDYPPEDVSLECTPKVRQVIKGPATLNGGEQCWCPDKSIPVN
jgi:hypothetical protein